MKWWLIVVVLFSGCSNPLTSVPLTSVEEEFLGTWVTEFSEEDGTKVGIVWTFESLFVGDRTAWNQIQRDDGFISQRKGEWKVLDSARLRVVLDSENLYVTDDYDGNPDEISGDSEGEFIGSILGGILRALTDDEYTIDYIRDVRPILAGNCYACHGPDDAVRQAGLRLDQHAGATRELASGNRAVVPGDPTSSELVRRVTSQDPDLRMPPRETNKQLTEHEQQTLREWIAAGAQYDVHWAFIAPRRPQPSVVQEESWIRNAIDAFVLARLDAGARLVGVDRDPEAVLEGEKQGSPGRRMQLSESGMVVRNPRNDRWVNQSHPVGSKLMFRAVSRCPDQKANACRPYEVTGNN